MCLTTFLKVKKCLLGGGARRKCPFCSSKDSVKAISDFIGTPYLQKSFDFDHNYTKVIPRPLALILL